MKKIVLFGISTVLSFSAFISPSYASVGDGKVSAFIGDQNYSSNVFDLNEKAGVVGAPKRQPWSGTFWPLRSGSTANPYAARIGKSKVGYIVSQTNGASTNMRLFENRMQRILSKMAAGKLSDQMIDEMAPSEKYDLYLGDHDFSFTHAEWQSVAEHKDFSGYMAMWEGTCHGWSMAAINEPRPAKAFTVPSLDGKYMIPFYPHDLKALSTRLWGNSLIQDFTISQGLRCNTRRAEKDKVTGKILNETCEGVNPGDFHVSLLELVGARKESFVINKKSNVLDVWNQPVAGYELNYFNPMTEEKGTLEKSVVRANAFKDPFQKFRAEGTKSLVGVEMTLKYTAETFPSHAATDSDQDDKINDLKIRYDLELDANNQVIGGEWRGKEAPGKKTETPDVAKYPGFLWKFIDQHPKAYSIADFDFEGTDLSKVSRDVLVAASKKASQFRYNHYNWDENGNATTVKRTELKPQPLAKVLDALFELAK
jgi:hypothetical protein